MRDKYGKFAEGNRQPRGSNHWSWKDAKIDKECLICKKVFNSYKSRKRKYCSWKCAVQARIGKPLSKEHCKKLSERQIAEKNHNWKGGRNISYYGYVFRYCPNHPHANKQYVQEHRLAMEKHLGRYLKPFEKVHHKNGIRNDNRIENLALFVFYKNWHPKTCPKCNFKFLIK